MEGLAAKLCECQIRHTSLAWKNKKPHERSHHRFAGDTRPSLRNGFNGFLRALPGDRALLPPSPAQRASVVAVLTPASGRLVPAFRSLCTFAARSFANFGKQRALVKFQIPVPLFDLKLLLWTRGNLSRNFKSAALVPHDFAVRSPVHSSSHRKRPPHPASTSVTIAIRPSCEAGRGELVEMICPTTQAGKFSKED
jgi:hypothetical protein